MARRGRGRREEGRRRRASDDAVSIGVPVPLLAVCDSLQLELRDRRLVLENCEDRDVTMQFNTVVSNRASQGPNPEESLMEIAARQSTNPG